MSWFFINGSFDHFGGSHIAFVFCQGLITIINKCNKLLWKDFLLFVLNFLVLRKLFCFWNIQVGSHLIQNELKSLRLILFHFIHFICQDCHSPFYPNLFFMRVIPFLKQCVTDLFSLCLMQWLGFHGFKYKLWIQFIH